VRLPDGRLAGIGLYVVLESDASGGFTTTQTDSSGKFSFDNLANARYRVRVNAPGYEEEAQEIDMSTTPIGYLKFALRPKPSLDKAQAVSGVIRTNPRFPQDMPQAAQKEFEQGLEIFSSGKNHQKSISHFKKSAEEYPKYPPTFYYLGAAQAINRNFDEAVPALQKCIELDGKAPEAMIALGSVYNSLRKYGEAERMLTRAVELAPNSFDAHEELAKALMPNLERTPEAEVHLRKAISLNSTSSEAHILLGNVLLRQRNTEGALKEYQESLRLNPKGPLADATREMISKIENGLKTAKE
jgi:tetratricopeptide (TPR) repeat protein